MCLAIEGKILKIEGASSHVDFGGIVRLVWLNLTPEAKVGDSVLVHAGYSIGVVHKEDSIDGYQNSGS